MKPTKEYISPDNQLRFVVDHDEQDVSLGFEGFPWHTHAGVLASEFGTSEELAVKRFVRDLLSDRSIVAVPRVSRTIRDVWITADPQSGISITSLMKSLSFGIGAAGCGSLPNKSSQPTRPAAGGFQGSSILSATDIALGHRRWVVAGKGMISCAGWGWTYLTTVTTSIVTPT